MKSQIRTLPQFALSVLKEFVLFFAFGAGLDWFLVASGFLKNRPGFAGIASTAAPIAIGMVIGSQLRKTSSRSVETPAATVLSGNSD